MTREQALRSIADAYAVLVSDYTSRREDEDAFREEMRTALRALGVTDAELPLI